MSFSHSTPYVDPRLGAYFGIFVSVYVGAFVLLLMFEQLGTSSQVLRLSALLGPLVLFAGIGVASATGDVQAFYAARRRVPAVYNGLVLALAATGSVGVVAFPGLMLINGYDAWCYLIGLTTGFVLMAVLITPFLRKFGAFTVPGYLARRFESRFLRLLAAAVLSVPIVIMLVAELSMTAYVARLLTGYDRGAMIGLIGVGVLACVLAGGMRGASWSSSAQAIAVLIAISVPAAMVAVMLTRLPVAPFSYGPVMRGLVTMEQVEGVKIVAAAPFAFGWAGMELEPLARRIAMPFSSVGPWSFTLIGLVIAAGTAGAPWLLARSGVTPSVYHARKSIGWAVLTVGILLLTLAATGAFVRDYMMSEVVGRSSDAVPGWFRELTGLGLVRLDGNALRLTLDGISVARDGVLFALPMAAGLPDVIAYLALAGALAAGLAALSATVLALAAILAEDVVGGLQWDPLPAVARLRVARVMIAAVTACATWFAMLVPTDPVRLVLWALSLSAATAFPLIVLSIWWKRLNVTGAAAGLVTGFVVTVLAIAAGEGAWLGLPSAIAGIVAMPFAMAVSVGVSLVTPPPGRAALEAAHEMRVPGGEAIQDREARLSRLKAR